MYKTQHRKAMSMSLLQTSTGQVCSEKPHIRDWDELVKYVMTKVIQMFQTATIHLEIHLVGINSIKLQVQCSQLCNVMDIIH